MDDYQDKKKQPEEEKKPGLLRGILRRFLGLIITVVVVLGLIVVTMLGTSNRLDGIRRWLLYGDGSDRQTYAFAAGSANRYGQIDDLLVVLNQNDLSILRDDGTAAFTQQVGMSQPALDVGGGFAVAYDVGGQKLVMASPEGEVLSLQLEEGHSFISARLNDSGWLAVVAERSGYRAAVSVYNDEQQLVYEVGISSRYLLDAVVSDDCGFVVAAAMTQEDGAFSGQLVAYSLQGEEPAWEASLGNHLVLDMDSLGDSYVTVSENDILFTDREGQGSQQFTYSGLYLRQYTLDGDGFGALLLNRYQAGSIGTLVTLDSQGEVIATQDIVQEVLDVSASGNYLAVLMSNSLLIYDRNLEEYARLEDTGYANHVIMQSDGSALVIGGSTAFRFLP